MPELISKKDEENIKEITRLIQLFNYYWYNPILKPTLKRKLKEKWQI